MSVFHNFSMKYLSIIKQNIMTLIRSKHYVFPSLCVTMLFSLKKITLMETNLYIIAKNKCLECNIKNCKVGTCAKALSKKESNLRNLSVYWIYYSKLYKVRRFCKPA